MKMILAEIGPDGRELGEKAFEVPLIRVGRDPQECEIVFASESFPMVSRHHADIRHDAGAWFIVDHNSTFGTFLDGRRIATERLAAGSEIQFGQDGPKIRVVWFEVVSDATPVPKAPAPASSPPPQAPPQARAASGTEPHQRLVFVEEPARKAVDIPANGIWVGRDPSCVITFDGGKVMVSRRHAEFRRENGQILVEDNGSFNGTYVNEDRIASPTVLADGDLIRFGIGGPLLKLDAQGARRATQLKSDSPEIVSIGGQSDAIAGSKTVVARIERTPPTPESSSHSQLMMTLEFGDKKHLVIGRDPSSDIRLDGLQISSKHARLLLQGGSVVIDDLNSTNGVFLNGGRVSRSQITPDDRVQIGSFEIKIDGRGSVSVFDTRSKTRIDAVEITKDIRSRGRSLRLLDGISISIQPNEFIGLLGPSGAGKSTLMDALNGFRPPDSGAVLINGRDLYRDLASLKHAIGYVPQDDIIHRELTVYRTLYYVARLRLSRDVSSAEIDKTVDEVLDVTGLADKRDVAISMLSGGQRKRVSIAVELVTKPSIIFLDEPTSGLDPRTEETIMQLFRQIAESGRTVILTTHAMENVRLFDKIAVLMRGRLVYFGPPAEALAFLGAANFKQLFDKLEAPVEQAVRSGGEVARAAATENAADGWKQRYAASPDYKKYIGDPQRTLASVPPGASGKRVRLGPIGAIRQWATLTRRYFEVLRKDKLNLAILFLQAPLIAILTFLVVGADKPRDFLYFILAIVSIWFGTSVAAREIIRERAVYARERMVNLGLVPYLASKFTVLGAIVVLQCMLLFVPLKLLDLIGIGSMPGDLAGIPQFWTMIVTAAVGLALGLFISAVVRTSEMATSLVPLVLIPQILLSGIVGVPTGVSRPLTMLVPAAWSFDTMKRFSSLDTLEPEGASPGDSTRGLGLYKQVEADNEKILTDARKDLESYQSKIETKMKQYEDARNAGLDPTMPVLDELPAVPNAKKMPADLSGYVTFLHPWMNEILNQFVLMLMFGILAIATIIVLRLKDIR